jgi:hypothetical protein
LQDYYSSPPRGNAADEMKVVQQMTEPRAGFYERYRKSESDEGNV